MNNKHSFSSVSLKWRILLNSVITLLSLTCIIPLILIISISFTDEDAIREHGYHFIPTKFSLMAYRFLIATKDQIITSYAVTLTITVVGTILGVLAMTAFAYPISRSSFKYRTAYSFFAFFTMLFNGGLLPFYIVCTRVLHLNNTIFALILPSCVSALNILILKTFFRTTIPESIIESGKIDGAGEIRIFAEIVLPMSLPAIATIGLFLSIGYWNDWWLSMLFITKSKLAPIQYLLKQIESSMDFVKENAGTLNSAEAADLLSKTPNETARMAMVVVAIGPIVFAYPFFQKYFIKGLTIGAVKG